MAQVEGDSSLQTDILEDLAGAARYRRWLVDLALPHLGDHPLEVGSGLGHYAAEWASAGVARLTASEADRGRLEALRERFAGDPVVAVRALSVPIEETAQHSAVVAYNVLEHVKDDIGVLRTFAELVRPGGAVVLVVPAFPSAMSDFDRAIGHQRRYRRHSLHRALDEAGLTVEVLHHVNAVGLLGWYLAVKLLGGQPRAGLLLTGYDRGVVPWLQWLETRCHPPFGQSLFAVARRR